MSCGRGSLGRMARPLRLEYPGSLWHVLTRGNAKQDIYLDTFDRELYLDLLGECVSKFRWILPTFTLMSNHTHSMVQLTEEGTLSRGMHWVDSGIGKKDSIWDGLVGQVGCSMVGKICRENRRPKA